MGCHGSRGRRNRVDSEGHPIKRRRSHRSVGDNFLSALFSFISLCSDHVKMPEPFLVACHCCSRGPISTNRRCVLGAPGSSPLRGAAISPPTTTLHAVVKPQHRFESPYHRPGRVGSSREDVQLTEFEVSCRSNLHVHCQTKRHAGMGATCYHVG